MFKLPARKNNQDWYPFSEIENLHKEMNRLFDFTFPRFGHADTALLSGNWTPVVDIQDTKDNIIVKVDLPGFKKEDIKVSVQDEVLTISGERKEEANSKEEGYVSFERYYGRFHRSVLLPAPVNANKLSATYKDGVLGLTLGKREDAKPKQITIDIK
jgi:HSP20 family protein